MSANPIWIAGYFGPVAGAAPVWIAPGDGTVPSAVQSQIVSYYAPVAGATAVWIAGFFAPPPAAIGATPITISGWGGSGGGGGGTTTSVWSASDAAANGMTLSNGGLTAAGVGAGWKSLRSTVSKTSGKLYFECFIINNASNGIIMGLADAGFVISSYLGTSPQSTGLGGLGIIMDDRAIVSGGFTSKGTVSNVPAANDVWGFAVDFTGGNIWVAINNVWAIGGNPATGSLPVVTFVQATVGALFAGVSLYDPSNSVTLQSTAASQKYAPPSGFSAWDGGVAPPPTSVWSSSDATANGMTLSNGGLTVNPNWTTGYAVIRSSISKTSGLLYAEFAVGAAPTQSSFSFGLASAGIDLHNFIGATNYGGSSCTYSIYDGASSGFTSNFQAPNVVPQTNDVVSIAVNFTTGSIWLAINNAWVGGGNPALTKNLPIISFVPATVGPLFLAFCASGSNPGVWTLQSTAASQKYAPPSGFVAWDAP